MKNILKSNGYRTVPFFITRYCLLTIFYVKLRLNILWGQNVTVTTAVYLEMSNEISQDQPHSGLVTYSVAGAKGMRTRSV